MIEWSIILFCLTLVVSLGQAIYVVRFARAMKGLNEPPSSTDKAPIAAVVLCVRGQDPTLEKCLSSIAELDYPSFKLHIVLDHEDDPASQLVNSFAARHDNVNVHLLAGPGEHCSLKCSSLVQVISNLKDDVEFVAMIDADAAPHRDWLKSIAAEISKDNVGLVSGIRCYSPEDDATGSLVRYQWNSAASVQMFAYRIPWGGTLALKLRTIKDLDLPSRWQSAFCEDTMLTSVIKNNNLKSSILPSLVMPNSETCQLTSFMSWVTRQLLTVRLYNPNWLLVVAHALLTTSTLIAAIITLTVSVAYSNPTAMFWSFLAFAVYMVGNWLMLISNQSSVNFQLAATNQSQTKFSFAKHLKLILLMPLTQCLYFVAVIRAMMLRKVSWRQMGYRINGPFEIERDEHVVYSVNHSGVNSI